MVSFHFSELSFPVSRILVLLTGFTAHSAASHNTRIQTQNHDRISHTFTFRHTLKLHVYLLEFLFEEQQPLLLHACTEKAFYSGACLSDRKERIVLLQSGRQKDVPGVAMQNTPDGLRHAKVTSVLCIRNAFEPARAIERPLYTHTRLM